MRQSITILILFFLTDVCHSQSISRIQYSLPQGLPSNEVYEVYQDQRKFIWFATDNGVVRFDGHTMVNFNVEQGLTDPVVFGFHEDFRGRIWFRTFSSKLCYYDYDKGRIVSYAHNDKLMPLCKNFYLQSIQVDSLDQLWFGLNTLWGKIDSAGNVTKNDIDVNCWTFYKSVGNKVVHGFCPVTVANSLSILDDKFLILDRTSTRRAHQVLCALRWRNKFYFSINSDLFEYDGSNTERVLTAKTGIMNLSLDRQDNLWIGTFGGVERHSDTSFKNPLRLPDFDNTPVSEVIQDHEMALWITTIGKGVFYVPNFDIKNQPLSTLDPLLPATLLNDRVLIASSNGDMMAVDKNTHQVVRKKKFANGVYSYFTDSEKNVWITSGQGTYILDSLLNLRHTVGRSMLSFYEDAQGIVWSLDKSVLLAVDKKGQVINRVRLDFYYRSMLMDEANIYLLARTGMHVFDKEFNRVKDLTALADYKFSKLLNLNDSTLLVSSIGNGFFLLNKNTWTHTQYNSRNKFVANDIYTAITADSSVWFGTEKGIIRTSINSLLKGEPSFQILTHKSGLIADKANQLLEVDDYIWAFFDNSYSAFPKNITLSSGNLPVFYVNSITVNNKPLPLSKNTLLAHTDNNLTVNFGFINFSNQNIFTRYRLAKGDEWSYTTERDLKFYSLSPGTYEFEIEYSIDNTRWTKAESSPRFTIVPPWWQTWYFQTMVGLLVLLIIFFYFKNQVEIYRKHQLKLIQSEIEAIEQERSRIAKDLHDSVGTDFSAIKMTVSQLLKKYNEPKSEEVETQFQSTIHEIKTIIYGLSPPGLERYGLMAGLKNYVDKLNGTIPVRIDLNSFGPDIRDPKLNITVFRVLQELISNSLKHSNAQTIALHINSFEDLLNIVYEDNGKGFNWGTVSKGLGLYNIESRIQSVNGQLRFDSGPFGISYTIDIPLKKGR